MTHARLYQRGKSATQSGRAAAGKWVLEHEPAPKHADPLTGWAGGGRTTEQVRLEFATLAAAQAYADKQGLTVRIVPAAERLLKLQSYADNFK